jgi:hypothetical protein
VRALRALFLVAALLWVGKMVFASIADVRAGNLVLDIRPGWLALSALFILATYCLLIWAWLYIVEGLSGRRIRYLDGARIWFISNLGQLLPGRVWGIIQMGAMSIDAGINPVAAGAASIINTVVNIATGLGVGVLAGTQILVAYTSTSRSLVWMIAVAAVAVILALPLLVPLAFRFGRRFGVRLPEAKLPVRLLAASAAANIAGWVLYGLAFLCLNHGLVHLASYSVVQHIAVNATSYVSGYLAIVVPAGLGVREKALQRVMLMANMGTSEQATAVSLVSRLWQLIIMILPALIFLAYRRPSNEKDAAAG